jgi:hypothetical protein
MSAQRQNYFGQGNYETTTAAVAEPTSPTMLLPSHYNLPVLHHGPLSLTTATTETPNIASQLNFEGS